MKGIDVRVRLQQTLCAAVLAVGVLQTTLPGQVFEFQIPDGIATVGEPVTIPLILDSTLGGDVVGWSFGVCHDPAELTVETVDLGEAVISRLGGGVPFFNQVLVESDGYTVGLILDPPFGFLPAGVSEISVASYTHQLAPGESTTLTPCNSLGTPMVETIAVETGGNSVFGILVPGTWTALAVPFVRGDVNDDGDVNLADGIFLLAELFAGGDVGLCPLAKDINADGAVDVADPIRLLNALFGGGPFPPAPFPDCDFAPNQTVADCPVYDSCP